MQLASNADPGMVRSKEAWLIVFVGCLYVGSSGHNGWRNNHADKGQRNNQIVHI